MTATSLKDKRILLIVAGGIAAYKTLELVRRLRERGAAVIAVLTRSGAEFVTPLSLAALTGNKVYQNLFDLTDEAEMGHIELSRAADLLVVAPATADLMAKMAGGHGDDLASTLLLATNKPVLIAPAMNVRMWLHPATRRNAATLAHDGIHFIGPNEGDMACGEYGPGRMAEPAEILAAIETLLAPGRGALSGRHVLVTSGPTHEPIDPVRYIANRSSGRQGHAIAAAAAQAGARVTLISGPVTIPDPDGVLTIHVETAKEMLEAALTALPADIAVCAAAVADWHVVGAGASKIKKAAGKLPDLALAENPDILATLSAHQRRPALVVGFAAETDKVVEHARQKLDKKGCDLIVANDVRPATGIMGGTENTVHLVGRDGVVDWPKLAKTEVARRLVAEFAARLGAKP